MPRIGLSFTEDVMEYSFSKGEVKELLKAGEVSLSR
jgi:hypothetical protein